MGKRIKRSIGIGFLGLLFSMGSGMAGTAAKNLEYRFPDGAGIRVHYSDKTLAQYGESAHFAKRVLDAAVSAYQTITEFQGFSTRGYSFANPDASYAEDPDRTIDIYLGDGDAFKDAPCFDTRPLSETRHEAMILLPANYRDFIRNWERLNPSSLGRRNIDVDLRGTLIHEMLHAILFYYNKNLNKKCQTDARGSASPVKTDWYVEGLARYFETFAGARHDFFSQGFKEMLPDKVRFSRGGSNYFMRYPDQAFTDLRYENALFWRYIDAKRGMGAIEAMSRDMRQEGAPDLERAIRKAAGTAVPELLNRFAIALLFNDFGLKEEAVYLREIAKTRLAYEKDGFYLKDGFGRKSALGRSCATDWIGQWENEKASLGGLAAAGDLTQAADVSGWATDFIEIKFDPSLSALPWIGVRMKDGGKPLNVQIVLMTRGGSHFVRRTPEIPRLRSAGLDLNALVRKEGLRSADIETVYLLITNTDPKITAPYEILSA